MYSKCKEKHIYKSMYSKYNKEITIHWEYIWKFTRQERMQAANMDLPIYQKRKKKEEGEYSKQLVIIFSKLTRLFIKWNERSHQPT